MKKQKRSHIKFILILLVAIILAGAFITHKYLLPYFTVNEIDIQSSTPKLADVQRDNNSNGTDAEPLSPYNFVKEADIPREPKPKASRQTLPEYDDILEINPYVSGWLHIYGTKIDAPVVYTPKDQNYFLHRSINGDDIDSGTLFIANLWNDGYNNTLIYGHNMRDKSGFGSLLNYADEEYGKEHNIIEFDTLYDKQKYELLAAFYTEINEDEIESDDERKEADNKVIEEGIKNKEESSPTPETTEPSTEPSGREKESESKEETPAPEEPATVPELTLADLDLSVDYGDADIYREEKDQDIQNNNFRFQFYTNLSSKEDYDYFVKNIKEMALYDTENTAQWGDELLTLSTCSYQTDNGRFVVVARKIQE